VKSHRIGALTLVIALGGGSWAAAASYTETSLGSGSHSLPGTAETTTGVGSLDSILGAIASGTDADMYRISITSPAAFSATTVGTTGTLGDTQLFLFRLSGIGIASNDDSPAGGTLRSALPLGNALLTALAPGDYYLVVVGYDTDPTSAGGEIFPDSPFTGVFGPTGPGGGSAITGYGGTSATGTYTIALTGAGFAGAVGAVVPAPPGIVLAVVGGLGLALGRRRARVAA
jgi:hypothetical protein